LLKAGFTVADLQVLKRLVSGLITHGQGGFTHVNTDHRERKRRSHTRKSNGENEMKKEL
jgi:hypothetical protein